MKKTWKNWFAALLMAAPLSAFAAGGGQYEPVEIDLGNQVSLQRGAQLFTNYCLSCHSASAMRYNRLQDIGLTEEEIKNNLMFTTDKVGDVMQSAMDPNDAKRWFGAAPPDLSLIARSRGADYLYAYMRGFYQDPTTATGWNNVVFNKVGMPHPFWAQQGIRRVELDEKGQPVMIQDEHGNTVPKLNWVSTGLQTRRLPDGNVITREFDNDMKDLVTYMVYMSEPAQIERKRIGYLVLLFLFAVMLPLAYFLKKEYWKDVH